MTAIQDIQRESASNAAARKQTEHLNRFNDKQPPNKNHKQHKNINGEGIQNITEAASLNQKTCFTHSATPQNSAPIDHGCQPQQVEPQNVPWQCPEQEQPLLRHPRPQQCIGVWWTKYQIIQPTHPSLHSSILVVSMNSFWIAAGNHQLTMYPDPLFSLAAMTKHAS